MAPLGVLVLGSFKALLLLAAAAAGAALLQRQPARLRVVVWATALAGTLLIPLVTPILPHLQLPVLPRLGRELVPAAGARVATATERDRSRLLPSSTPQRAKRHRPNRPFVSNASPRWPTLMLLGWAAGAGIALSRLGVALWRTRRLIPDTQCRSRIRDGSTTSRRPSDALACGVPLGHHQPRVKIRATVAAPSVRR